MIERDGVFVTFICELCPARITIVGDSVTLAAREARPHGWAVDVWNEVEPTVHCPRHRHFVEAA